jgi:hypothetical protein
MARRTAGLPARQPAVAELVGSDCTLKVLEGSSHELHLEPEKDVVLAYVLDWIEQHNTAAQGRSPSRCVHRRRRGALLRRGRYAAGRQLVQVEGGRATPVVVSA